MRRMLGLPCEDQRGRRTSLCPSGGRRPKSRGGDLQPLLAAERILPKDSQEKGDTTAGHEGELTAAKRLVDKVLRLYGPRFV